MTANVPVKHTINISKDNFKPTQLCSDNSVFLEIMCFYKEYEKEWFNNLNHSLD